MNMFFKGNKLYDLAVSLNHKQVQLAFSISYSTSSGFFRDAITTLLK